LRPSHICLAGNDLGQKMTFTFDTLAYAKALRAANVENTQAEAMADALKGALTRGSSELATKADLAELKAELLKWMFGQAIAIVGLTVALMKLL
jgi:hypothetical protein